MKREGALRAGCLAAAALVPMAAVPAPAAAQAQARVNYDLPAQDLGDMLRAIARLSGGEIIFVPEAVRGRRAPPVRGPLTLEEAARAAIAGTDLVAELREGAVLVREPSRRTGTAAPPEEQAGITVTGTRIRGADSASPLIVTTRRQLEEAGVTDLAGFTRILPQNFTGGQNPGVAGGGQQGGQNNINNSATLNLRGLGPDATLTLINGHRIAYDALNQGIDISAIPLGALERIEIIPDGASALYGSDAVGGVANIILRRPFDGLEASARLGASTAGGNVQQQYSLVGGARWTSGGLMAAFDHSRATPIFADQRDYTRSLDPSLTLTLGNSQLSGVLAGQQQLTGGLSVDMDGFIMQRRSRKQTPFRPDADVFTNGLTTRPELRSYALAPTIRLDLPGQWQASLGATRAVSRTRIDTRRYFNDTVSPSRLVYENRLSGVEASAEGPLFAAPGGDARLAVGGGLRNLVLDLNVADIVGGAAVTARAFTESRDVQFAYAELSFPLVGPDLSVPLIERLRLSAAVRYERYEGIDEVATPKLGLVYQPHPDITVRASWGRSFKVPTLNQVNQVLQGALLPGRFFVPQPDPALAPGATILLLGGGNPDLRAERAATWSATLELRPRLLHGLRIEASYFDIDYRDRITSPISGVLSALPNPIYRDLIIFNPTVDQVNSLIATLPQGLSNQTGQPFDPASVAAIVDTALRNTAREHLRGVDFSADYPIRLGPDDRLLISASVSYLENDLQLTPVQPLTQRVGTIFNPPHWRGRLAAVWQGRRAGLSAALNYVGATRDNRFPEAGPVGPFVTLDVSASLRTGAEAGPFRNVELRLSALNLLDEAPDMILNSQPEAPSYDSTNQSPVGRFVSLSVRKQW